MEENREELDTDLFKPRYTPKKLALSDKRGKFMDSCLLELKSWQYSLPSELKPTDENRHEHLPQAYLLLMVYHTAVILLAKPFVQEAGTEATGTPDAPKPTPLQQKAQQCYLEAARNIASLGDQYRRNVGSFRTSPISATYTSLSAVLALLDCQRNSNRPLNRPGNPDHGHIVACLTTLEQLSTAWMPPGKYHRNVLKLIRSKWTVEDAEGFDEGLQKSLDDTPLDTSISGALGDWNQLTDPGDPVFNNAPLPLWMPGLEGDMSAQHSAGDGTGLFQIPEEFLNTQLDPFLTWSDFTQAGDANNDRGN